MASKENFSGLTKTEFQNLLVGRAIKGEDPMSILALSGLALPLRLVIIPDGNGRWAQNHGLAIAEGHRKGAQVMENLLNDLEKLPGIREVTFWALSVDNLAKRPPGEVANIMQLTEAMIDSLLPTIKARGNRFTHLGELQSLPQSLQDKLLHAQKETKHNSGKIVRVAINYQGFQEDMALANAAIEAFVAQGRRPVSRKDIEALKYTSQTPPADFVIRTSGEQRFSGLGSIAEQAEFYAPSTLLPDMTSLSWALALSEYAFRQRRFGARV